MIVNKVFNSETEIYVPIVFGANLGKSKSVPIHLYNLSQDIIILRLFKFVISLNNFFILFLISFTISKYENGAYRSQ